MSARDRILARLRAAPVDTKPTLPDVANWYSSHSRDESNSERIMRLRTALEASRAEVYDTNRADWPALLVRIAIGKRIRNLLIGTPIPQQELLESRTTGDLQFVRYSDYSIGSWKTTLFDEIDAGLTFAKSAIAETGSLVLWPDANEPRLMSLVPPIHFVLLDTATIHPDFYSAMTAENWKDGLPANALLISGPSKTADIQQTLAYGAHGPRELVVLLQHGEGVTQ